MSDIGKTAQARELGVTLMPAKGTSRTTRRELLLQAASIAAYSAAKAHLPAVLAESHVDIGIRPRWRQPRRAAGRAAHSERAARDGTAPHRSSAARGRRRAAWDRR